MTSRRQVLSVFLATTAAGVARHVSAQSPYPQKLVKIFVGNAPGGTDDLISRIVAEKIGPEFGQTVIVENRGGASTTIAGAAVAKSAPDGYTVLCLINTGIVQTVLKPSLTYKLDSFVPVVGVGGFPLALAVSTTAPPKIANLDELAAVARSGEGITYASGGVGTMAHLNTVRLLKALNGKGVHVTYKNNPEGLAALMGGYTQMMLASASEVAPLKADGKLRVLAVTSPTRASNLPDVPTMRELGFPTIDATLWHGYVVPAGTPPQVVATLADAITRAVRSSDFQTRLKPMGFQEDITTGEALSAFINGQAARWKEVITENNIKVE
jgi:tripartite-type tricarboxylate transporter receptor subunit TctC